MDSNQLNQLHKNIFDSVGLLQQLGITAEQKNIAILFNVYGFLNVTLAELQSEIEKQQQNNA